MNVQNDSFIQLLQRTLEAKCAANPRFSLRAQAKQLGISPASLSGVINGRRKLSLAMVEKIGLRIGLDQEQVWEHQRELLGAALESDSQNRFSQIAQDEFAVIADWYNLAILEVMKLVDFKPDSSWIAKKLGVNPNQINSAIERLKRLKILELKNSKWTDRTEGFTTHLEANKTSEARRLYQKQLLEKSIEAITQDSIEFRDHTSMTMAIDAADLPIAKHEIAKFRRRLSKLLEKRSRPNRVYQLQISFFSLTK